MPMVQGGGLEELEWDGLLEEELLEETEEAQSTMDELRKSPPSARRDRLRMRSRPD